jgi:hypothetical protein
MEQTSLIHEDPRRLTFRQGNARRRGARGDGFGLCESGRRSTLRSKSVARSLALCETIADTTSKSRPNISMNNARRWPDARTDRWARNQIPLPTTISQCRVIFASCGAAPRRASALCARIASQQGKCRVHLQCRKRACGCAHRQLEGVEVRCAGARLINSGPGWLRRHSRARTRRRRGW